MNKIETLQPDRLEQQVRAGNSPLIKPILPRVVRDLPNDERTEQLVDLMLKSVSERLAVQEKEAFWSNELNEYINFPKQTGPEQRHAENLVTKTASKLLENPQDINIAEETWRRIELCRVGDQGSEEQFSKKVKEKMLKIIGEKKESATPEQFAGLVRIYVNKDESQKSTSEFAGNLLKNCLNSPKKSRRQRINAFYNFVSGALDLAREDKAYKEGLRIALFATDILPKNPILIEQAVLLSLPYGEKEEDFKKLLIAKHVVNQASSMHSQDFAQFHQANVHFIATDEKAKREWDKRRKAVTKKIGSDGARDFNDTMRSFFRISQGPLSEEMKQRLKNSWPFNLAFDETDPLNQKYKRVFSDQLSPSSQVSS